MIRIEDYIEELQYHKELLNFFSTEFEENASREETCSKKHNKKIRKQIEKRELEAYNVFQANLRSLLKNSGYTYKIVEKKQENWFVRLINKIFNKKNQESEMILEQKETNFIEDAKVEEVCETEETNNSTEDTTDIDDSKDTEVCSDETNYTIEGQMDIEDLDSKENKN